MERTIHCQKLGDADTDALWELHTLYKSEIGESAPGQEEKRRLADAIRQGDIQFYGAWDGDRLVGCCSIATGFSTFNYLPSGVFEDFFIRPEYRHAGIARQLVTFARQKSGVYSLTVGCADCDAEMYRALGFTVSLGSLLAYD